MQTQITDANSKVTTVQYDGYGRLTKVWLPNQSTGGNPTYEYIYTPSARPAHIKSRTVNYASSNIYFESWTYVDGFGRTIQTQRPSVNAGKRVLASSQYNNRGLLKHQSIPYEDATGYAGNGYLQPAWSSVANYQRFSYDDLGRQSKAETMYLGTAQYDSEVVYDGWVQQHFDANNHQRVIETNAFGQQVKVTEYNVGSVAYNTTYSYDLLGKLTRVQDQLSNTTTMTYDRLGRKTAMTDPDMGSWSYTYDANGNLTSQKDGRNLWIYMSYDDLNRLTIKRKDSTSGPKIAEYVYDTLQRGQLYASKVYDAAGSSVVAETQTSALDTLYRPTERKWLLGSDSFRMAYGYDEAGHLNSQTYPGNNANGLGEVITRHFNNWGQFYSMTSGQDSVQFVSGTAYYPDGALSYERYDTGSNGGERNISVYAGDRRVAALLFGNGGSTNNLQNLTFTYDAVGNVASLTDALNSSQKQCFQYDWLDRLTAAFSGNSGCTAYSATGTGPYNHTYAYNEIGNITTNAGAAYTYGDAAHKHAVTAAHGNTYGYDANGNQTSRTISGVTYTFTYDYENRLVSVSGGSISSTFIYDASGNRVKGTVNGVTTIYIEGIYEYQGGATTKYYSGASGTIALRRTSYASDNGIYYLLRDHLNSSSVMLTRSGTVAKREFYYPYGGNRGLAFSSLTTQRFTGQYHESALPGGEGLSYYGARWYDAKLGRFLSADTIVPNPDNPQTINRYSYAGNNPTSRMDPTGHADCKVGSCPSVPGTANFVLPNIEIEPGDRRTSPSSADALNWTIAHMDLVVAKSGEYGVSPILVAGLITAEIDLDNTAVGIYLDEYTRTAFARLSIVENSSFAAASAFPTDAALWVGLVTDTKNNYLSMVTELVDIRMLITKLTKLLITIWPKHTVSLLLTERKKQVICPTC